MADTLTVELEITDDQADVVLSRTKQKLGDFVKDVERKQPQIKFSVPGDSFIELDKLEQKASETHRRFAEIAGVRLNNGQVGNLSREIVVAAERSRQLSNDIAGIKRELINPNRKSSIAFLTEELIAAEKEAAILEGRLATLNRSRAVNAAGGGLSAFQKQQLFYQANDVATMAAMGAGPGQILASQGGQIAQLMDLSKLAPVLASIGPMIAAGAVAAALVYKITGDIRRESEDRLALEEKISAAINKQKLGYAESNAELQKMLAAAAGNRALDTFNRDIAGVDNVDDLNARLEALRAKRDRFAKYSAVDPKMTVDGYDQNVSDTVKTLDQEIVSITDRIAKLPAELAAKANAAGSNSIEQAHKVWLQGQEDARKSAEVFAKSVEEGKKKVQDLADGWRSAFDGLESRFNSDNPFAAFLQKSESEAEKLKDSLKGLPPELQKVAFAMKAVSDSRDAFSLRIDNALSVANLRFQANEFINPLDTTAQGARQNQFIANFLRNNPNFLNLNRGKSREQLRKDILGFAGDPSLTETAGDRRNSFLQDQANIIFDQRRPGFDRAAADKKFIALTNGIDIRDLPENLRRAAADSRLNEAARLEKQEQDAKEDRKAELEIRKRFADAVNKLDQLAQKGGLNAVNVKIQNEAPENARAATAATPADVANYQFDGFGLAGGSNF